MKLVATLISDNNAKVMDDALLRSIRTTVGGHEEPVWLNSGQSAADIFCETAKAAQDIENEIRTALHELPVDIIVQPAATRRKSLFLADMDSTMIDQECIDELADYVGLKDKVSHITERAMRGEIAFEPALRERVALLKGLPVSVVDEIIETRLTLTPGGSELVRTMRANGAYTCLVSGGFTLFTSRIGTMIGFHEDRSNTLVVEEGKLAGAVTDPIIGKEAKLATLLELCQKHGLAAVDTMAVGDGANDLAMLQGAGLGVAFRAKPAVAAAAHARIAHSDLSALLYAQGYKDADFIK